MLSFGSCSLVADGPVSLVGVDGLGLGLGLTNGDGLIGDDGLQLADGLLGVDGLGLADRLVGVDGLGLADGLVAVNGLGLANGFVGVDRLGLADRLVGVDGLRLTDSIVEVDWLSMRLGLGLLVMIVGLGIQESLENLGQILNILPAQLVIITVWLSGCSRVRTSMEKCLRGCNDNKQEDEKLHYDFFDLICFSAEVCFCNDILHWMSACFNTRVTGIRIVAINSPHAPDSFDLRLPR